MANQRKKLILIGGGLRGLAYTDIASMMPDKFEVVALAEPLPERREFLRQRLNIPEERAYTTWEPLLAQPKLADGAFICTMDRDHCAPALAAIRRGYHLMLEKPAAALPEDCVRIEREAKRCGVHVLVCHVLRYTKFFRALKTLLDEGTIGEIVTIQHREDVGNVHQSHSFVRGNWGNCDRSSVMILQKSCHDMDILQWLIGRPCKRVQSFGSLSYFKAENAPEGAPERCLDGCPVGDSCPYNARKLYLESDSGWFRTASTRLPQPTDADVERALRTTQYGKCVFRCDNNAVDHQIVNLEFEGGITANFSMSAFSRGGRELRVMGTKGVLSGRPGGETLTLFDFETRNETEISVNDKVLDESLVGGHGGGDAGVVTAFYDLLTGVANFSVCDISESVENHMIAFAAEESRLSGTVVDVAAYSASIRRAVDEADKMSGR